MACEKLTHRTQQGLNALKLIARGHWEEVKTQERVTRAITLKSWVRWELGGMQGLLQEDTDVSWTYTAMNTGEGLHDLYDFSRKVPAQLWFSHFLTTAQMSDSKDEGLPGRQLPWQLITWRSRNLQPLHARHWLPLVLVLTTVVWQEASWGREDSLWLMVWRNTVQLITVEKAQQCEQLELPGDLLTSQRTKKKGEGGNEGTRENKKLAPEAELRLDPKYSLLFTQTLLTKLFCSFPKQRHPLGTECPNVRLWGTAHI